MSVYAIQPTFDGGDGHYITSHKTKSKFKPNDLPPYIRKCSYRGANGSYRGANGYCKLKINLKLCSGCKVVKYCSKQCQKKDWINHKSKCRKTIKNFIDL